MKCDACFAFDVSELIVYKGKCTIGDVSELFGVLSTLSRFVFMYN